MRLIAKTTGLLLAASAALTCACSEAALPAADPQGQPLPTLAPMLERVTPAVVNIQSRQVVRMNNPLAADPFFRRFFGLPDMPQQRVEQSLGSGVIVDAEQGLVLTNNHVIEAADGIGVTLADGRTLEGELVGADPDTDVAVIRIPAEQLTALNLADSGDLRVGDFVVAVGNPFGLGQTVTSGIVSALGRTGLRGLGYQNFIQTDASINPGNSGGALVNLRGELVGINSAIFSPSGGNIGIGFAIPANLAREVMRQLIAYGEVRRGSLGVEAQDITAELQRAFDLKTRRGAVVARVYPGSPAERAGLRVGDVIVALDGQGVGDRQALHNLEGLVAVGRPIAVRVLRDGDEVELSATLAARPKDLEGDTLDPRLAGASFTHVPERLRQQGVRGVVVSKVAPNSVAAIGGLRAGDRIEQIGRQPTPDLSAFQAALAVRDTPLALTLVRGYRRGVLTLD
jgi:serine protease DegQ